MCIYYEFDLETIRRPSSDEGPPFHNFALFEYDKINRRGTRAFFSSVNSNSRLCKIKKKGYIIIHA